jgi:hypothetical protein
MAKLGKFEAAIIKELKTKGFRYKDSNEIFNQSSLESIEVNIILKWLPKVYTESYGTADILVRSLIVALWPFDPTVLIDLFENSTYNSALKGGIAVTLSSARTYDISDWIKDQLLSKEFAIERVPLLWALPKKCGFGSEAELMNFVQQIFDKYHGEDVQKYFKKFGRAEDALFLRRQISKMDKKYQEKFEKIAQFIENKKT